MTLPKLLYEFVTETTQPNTAQHTTPHNTYREVLRIASDEQLHGDVLHVQLFLLSLLVGHFVLLVLVRPVGALLREEKA